MYIYKQIFTAVVLLGVDNSLITSTRVIKGKEDSDKRGERRRDTGME